MHIYCLYRFWWHLPPLLFVYNISNSCTRLLTSLHTRVLTCVLLQKWSSLPWGLRGAGTREADRNTWQDLGVFMNLVSQNRGHGQVPRMKSPAQFVEKLVYLITASKLLIDVCIRVWPSWPIWRRWFQAWICMYIRFATGPWFRQHWDVYFVVVNVCCSSIQSSSSVCGRIMTRQVLMAVYQFIFICNSPM